MKPSSIVKHLAVALIAAASLLTSAIAGDKKAEDKMMKDGVMMKDGKMMVMKGGETMMMKENMTMTNGTKVMTDGTVIMGEKKMMMKDCDMVGMDGTMKCDNAIHTKGTGGT